MCGMGCLEKVGFKAVPQRGYIYFLQVENTVDKNLGDLERKKCITNCLDKESKEHSCVGHNTTASVCGSVCTDT